MNAVSLTSGMRQNLFSMQRTSRLLATNAIRLNTGKKVSSAMDNPVSFFTSIQHMNRANDLAMRKAEMGEGVQTVQAASNGIDSMIDLIESAESIAQSALSAETSEERETLANQYNETLNQISAVADDASYKGVGLLRCPPESLCVNLNEKGDSSLTVDGECASAEGLGLNNVGMNGSGSVDQSSVFVSNAPSVSVTVNNPSAINTPVSEFQIAHHVSKPRFEGDAVNHPFAVLLTASTAPLTTDFKDFTVHWDNSSSTWSITNGNEPTGPYPSAEVGIHSSDWFAVLIDGWATSPEIYGKPDGHLTADGDIKFDIFDDLGIANGDVEYPNATIQRATSTTYEIDLDGNGEADITIDGVSGGSNLGHYITFDLVIDSGTWDSPSNIQTSLDELAAAKQRLRTLQEKFSTNLNIITTRSSFTDSMVNILGTGADNLTNADMNEEGANALMLQTQQSLGTTSLSMAAQAAQSVLRLFN
jgi:flagellin